MSKKVFLNAGHGGRDSGAVKYIVEKDTNLKMARACRDYLIANGVEVLMGRDADVDRTSTQITNMCNSYNPDCAVDIHNNAGGGDGFEVYHSINPQSKGVPLAKAIEEEVKKIGQNSRGCKSRKGSNGDYYYFIRNITCPSVICEGVFVDNKADAAQADTDEECRTFGEAYAKGILKFLGIPDSNTSKPVNTTKPSITTPSSVSSANTDTYTVVKGDTLSAIAKKYNTTISVLQAMNGIKNINKIYPGQILKIPVKSVSMSPASKPTTENSSSSTTKFDATYRNGKAYIVNSSNGVNVRKGAGISKENIGAIPYGTKVMWYGYFEDADGMTWKYVNITNGSFKGKNGWIAAKYLK